MNSVREIARSVFVRLVTLMLGPRFLRWFIARRYRFAEVVPLDNWDVSNPGVSGVLWPASRRVASIVGAARDNRHAILECGSDEHRYFVLSNASLRLPNRVSGALVGSTFLVSKPRGASPWRVFRGHRTARQGGVLYQQDNRVLFDLGSRKIEYPEGILVGSWAPNNWYMWVSSWLPTVFILQNLPTRYDQVPILMPESVAPRANWTETLDLVREDRPILFVPNDKPFSVKSLIIADSPLDRGPFPAEKPFQQSLRGISLDPVRAYVTSITTSSLVSKAEETDLGLIFIYRAPGLARPDNQDELVEVARDFGFETVDFAELNFADTVKMVQGARFIIGAHGAGWVNLLFCRPGTGGIMWAQPDARENNNFSNLAVAAQVDLQIHWMTPADCADSKVGGPSFVFPAHRLHRLLEQERADGSL